MKRGTITIFSSLLLVVVLFLASAAFDSAIMTAANARFRSSVGCAARSVCSNHNDFLISQYGLFAYDINRNYGETEKQFKQYLGYNLERFGAASNAIKRMETGIIYIKGINSIVEPDEFRKQVVDSGRSYAEIMFADEAFKAISMLFDDEGSSDLRNPEISKGELKDSTELEENKKSALGNVFSIIKDIAGNSGEFLKIIRQDWINRAEKFQDRNDKDYETDETDEEDEGDDGDETANEDLIAGNIVDLTDSRDIMDELHEDGGLFDSLRGILECGLDKLSITSYAFNHFSFMVGGNKESHFFKRGEVEYLLYGRRMQISNILAAAYEIFIIRFIINTVSLFISNNYPDPVSGMIAASIDGLIAAALDMTTLLAGGSISLLPANSSIQADYRFHLTLLFMVRCVFDETGILNRMKHIIQTNGMQSDKDFILSDMVTGIEYSVKADIVLPITRLNIEFFKKGRFVYGMPA